MRAIGHYACLVTAGGTHVSMYQGRQSSSLAWLSTGTEWLQLCLTRIERAGLVMDRSFVRCKKCRDGSDYENIRLRELADMTDNMLK
jgi:hypothetical protein